MREFEGPADLPPEPTPTIEPGVRGPRGEIGFFLRAPASEELTWDLEMEIAPARRQRLEERGGWWIDSSYLTTVVEAVLRTFPALRILGEQEDRLLSKDGSEVQQVRLL